MEKFYPPENDKKQFHCVHCQVYAAQFWKPFFFNNPRGSTEVHGSLKYCICSHCGGWSYWYEGKMVIPSAASVPVAHIDLPSACKSEYQEAREIVSKSPRAAAALIRLALQKLMVELGEKGEKINVDIGSLVAKGLPVVVQQALDYCRVVGNHAVHPGEIALNDTPEIAHQLFAMVNFIVEDRIARPKHIHALYEQLPDGARQAIEARDSKKA